jgi:hypothetical protein
MMIPVDFFPPSVGKKALVWNFFNYFEALLQVQN